MAKTTEKTTKAEVKPVEVVAEVKAVAEETKETVKKAATKKTTAEKKETTKKTAAKKEEKNKGTAIFVQYQNQQQTTEVIIERVKAQYEAEGHRVSGIKSLNIYIKPEDGQAYYVINDKTAGAVSLF